MLDVIGFGSLNIDEFWDVPHSFCVEQDLRPGSEYVKDSVWFSRAYSLLQAVGINNGVSPGGSAANTVAALYRMGYRTGFAGCSGRHDAHLIDLKDLGNPDDVRIRFSEIPSGRCLSITDRDDMSKDRVLVIAPNANDYAAEMELDYGYFAQSRWIHLTSFVSHQVLSKQIELLESDLVGVNISFDPGVVYCSRGIDALMAILQRTTVLFITEEELDLLVPLVDIENKISKLQEIGVALVVIKKGERGLECRAGTQKFVQPAALPRKIIDRTGAGDVVAAGFIAGLLENLTLQSCLRFAVEAASLSIENYGRKSYPERSFRKKMMEQFLNHTR